MGNLIDTEEKRLHVTRLAYTYRDSFVSRVEDIITSTLTHMSSHFVIASFATRRNIKGTRESES